MSSSSRPSLTSSSPVAGRELALVTFAAVVAIGIFLWNANLHGALSIPRDDDWSYLKTAFTFHRTGAIDLNGWAYTTLIGQILMAWPLIVVFGASILPLQLLVAAFGIVGIVLCYAVLRRVASPGVSSLGTVVTVVGPIFGTDTTTFMTDIPVLTLQMLTLLLGCLALTSPRPWPSLAAATVSGIAAFSIRQSGVVALVVVFAVFAGKVLVERRTIRPLVWWALAIVATLLPIYLFRQSLPNGVYSALDFPPFPRPGVTDRLTTIARSGVTLALLTAPALLLLSPSRLVRTAWRDSRLGTISVLLLAVVGIVMSRNSLLGNHVHPFGDTWMVAGEGARLLPLNAYRMLMVVSDIAFILLALATWVIIRFVIHRCREAGWKASMLRALTFRPAALVVYGFGPVMFLANLAATAILGAPFIDRYLIATVPFTVVAVVNGGRRAGIATVPVRRFVVAIGTAIYAIFGFMVVDFSATVDGAKWDFARQAVEAGTPAEHIDGGVEWFGYHQDAESGPLQDITGRTWWTTRFPDQTVCRTVQISSTERLTNPYGDVALQQTYTTLFGHRILLSLVRGPDSC